jgi:hypothetical protein
MLKQLFIQKQEPGMQNNPPDNTNRLGHHNLWQKEFTIPPRFPRLDLRERITKLLEESEEPALFLRRTRRNNVEIVIRLNSSLNAEQTELLKGLDSSGATLADAFNEVVWKKLAGSLNSAWADFSRLAAEAYRETLLLSLKRSFVNCAHPQVHDQRATLIDHIFNSSKTIRKGRRATFIPQQTILQARYRELLSKCQLVHHAAEEVSLAAKITRRDNSAAIRKGIWKRIKHVVYGGSGYEKIYADEAFARISAQSTSKS